MLKLKRLETRLLAGLFAVVIGSSLSISVLGYHLYKDSLLQNLTSQALSRAQSISLQATEKILINDLVALQKMLFQEKESYSGIAYLLVLRDGAPLAHTFGSGVPEALIPANSPRQGQPNMREIISSKGQKFVDVAWPIFEGRAGILRLGLDERIFGSLLFSFWLKTAGMTALILLAALAAGLIFIRRSSSPLANLTEAVTRIVHGESGVRVPVFGRDEVGVLSESFNQMVEKIENYTGKLERQAEELERANAQTRLFCHIVQEIGSIADLKQIAGYLADRFGGLVDAGAMALMVLDESREALFVLAERGVTKVEDQAGIETFAGFSSQIKDVQIVDDPGLAVPLSPRFLSGWTRRSLIPLPLNGRVTGLLILGCDDHCRCNEQDLNLLKLILSQAGGVIHRAVRYELEMDRIRSKFLAAQSFRGIIGKDQQMQAIFRLIEDAAPTDASILIQGESGTGKELVARAIHESSTRKDKPFVVINCSAYPSTLLESELFGHEKGAFTGAIKAKPGRFEKADGGTVFLDEVGEIPLSAQVKLLRVLQTQEFERLGGERTISVNVRILAATNKQLLEEVKTGAFREDLYYRLNVIQIKLPPLRDRCNDIPLLVRHFLKKFSLEQGKEVVWFSHEAMRTVLDAPWPGNVRELENAVEHAVVLAKGKHIQLPDLPASLIAESESRQKNILDHERDLIGNVLNECEWNKAEAARRLGISRSTLYEKIRRYDLVDPAVH